MRQISRTTRLLIIVLAMAVAGLVIYGSIRLLHPPSQTAERKIAFYQCSMHPWVKSDKPAKCSICCMDLTPIFEGDAGVAVSGDMVKLSPNGVSVLNVQVAEVKRQTLRRTLRVAGTLDVDETRRAIVSAPALSRVIVLNVPYVGAEVSKGQPLLTLSGLDLAQKWYYLRAATQARPGTGPDSALNGDAFTAPLTAPISGTVVERLISLGETVEEGRRLLTIVDPSVLWFRFDVYEHQLPWCELGQTIAVTTPAVPGKVFPAVVDFIEPTVGETARTVKVRADIRNPRVVINGHTQRLLRFDMYAEGRLIAEIPDVLAVPRSAILCPGGVNYAYLAKGDGAYEMRRVRLGRQGDELVEVTGGLEEGDRVATTGNVLIDAQAQFNRGDSRDEALAEANAADEPVAPFGAGETIADESSLAPPVSLDASALAGGIAATAPAGGTVATAPAAAARASAIATSMPAATQPQADEPTSSRVYYRNLRLAAMPVLKDKYVAMHKTPTFDPDAPGMDEVLRLARQQAAEAAARADAATSTQPTSNPANFSDAQSRAIRDFLAEADGMSQALAADDLDQFNQHLTRLAAVVGPLQKELAGQPRWADLLQPLGPFGDEAEPAEDLSDARKQFLPFSTATVALVRQLRKDDRSFASFKVYHCPMAPQTRALGAGAGAAAEPVLRC